MRRRLSRRWLPRGQTEAVPPPDLSSINVQAGVGDA